MPDDPEGGDDTPGDTPEQRQQTIRQMQRHFHDQIGARTESAVADLNTRWQSVRATLDEQIAQLTIAMRKAQDAGDSTDLAWLTRARELAELKASVMGNVGDFANEAAALSGDAMYDALDLGQGAAQALLSASVPPGLGVTFGVPPSDVLDAAAGALQPGSPLQDVFDSFASDAWQFAQQALFTAIALGDSAAETAERLEWATNMPLQRAMVIARTELHRAWRGAQIANYRANNDVVQGWMWACDFGPRSCGACIALDGTTHTLDEDFDDHICGRCSALPITLPWSQILGDAGMSQQQIADLGLTGAGETSAASWAGLAEGGVFRTRETGAEWFARQDAETQNRILGPAAAQAWRAGDVTLDDFVGYKESATWGTSIYQKSLKEMDLDASAYLAETRANGTDSVVGGAVTPDTNVQPLTPDQFQQQQADALNDPAAIAARKAAADTWYADVQRQIDGITSGTVDDWADAHHGLDAWHDQVQSAIAAGEPIPIYDWDIRREEAIAVAEGRASWLSEGQPNGASVTVRRLTRPI